MHCIASTARRAIFGTLTCLVLIIAIQAHAQSCDGFRVRADYHAPGLRPEPWIGEWEYYTDPNERLAAKERACRSFGQQWGQDIAITRYPASLGYSSPGWEYYDCTHNGYNLRVFATYSNGSIHGGTIFLGLEDVGSQCLPFDRKKSVGQQCTDAGNPINLATGNKFQVEYDYRSSDGRLEFARYYNSEPAAAPISDPHVSWLGSRWGSTYERTLRMGTTTAPVVYAYRPDGKILTFYKSGSSFLPDADVIDRLRQQFDASNVFIGWRYTVGQTDDIESYGVDGRLQSITTRAGAITLMAYDAAGRLVSVTDPFGKVLSFSYDASNQLTALTIPGGQSFGYSYDGAGNLVGVTGPDATFRGYLYNEPAYTSGISLAHAMTGIVDENGERYATFRYNALGQVVSTEHVGGVDKYEITSLSSTSGGSTTFTDPLGKSRTIGLNNVKGVPRVSGTSERSDLSCARHKTAQYDANGNVIASVDFNNVRTTRVVDLARNLETSRTEAAGTALSRTIITGWHANYRIPISLVNERQRTTYTHDTVGNVLTRTHYDSTAVSSSTRTWTYTYNAFGQALTEDGPRTDVVDVTINTYHSCGTGSECGQLHTVTNAQGHVTTYHTYNAHGQPLTITDPNGVVTTLEYDSRNRLTSRTVGTEITSFEYWPTGLLKRATLIDGTYLQYAYDGAHRLTGISDADGNRIEYELDPIGNRVSERVYDPSNALARSRTRVFDALNRLQQDIGAAGTVDVTVTYGYDDNGNQTSVSAPLGRDTLNDYDELNRQVHVTDALGGVTQYGYNRLDQLISVTDPKLLVTSYAYNANGELQSLTSPDTGLTKYTYDSGANVATRTDARNAVATFSYDVLNRVTATSFSAGGAADQTVTYAYDAGVYGKGKLTGVSDASHSLAWTYDELGRVVTAAQTVGSVTKTVSYAYADGVRQSMTTPSGQVITYGYTNGKVTSVNVNGASLISDVLYDPFGPVRQWTWGNSSLVVRAFDQDGKITRIDSAGLKTYSYDAAFRITNIADASDAAVSWTYDYDDLDRLTDAAKSGTTLGYTYDANGNRLTQVGSVASTFTVAPSSNRLTSIAGALNRMYGYDVAGNTTSFTGITFTYNNRGRMKSSTKNGVTTNYTYNALGQLIKKGSTALYYYDDADRVLGIYDSAGVLTEEIVWLGDTPLATLRPRAGGVDVYYIHSDHLNTPRLITDSSNSVRWRWDAEPFGSGAVNDNPIGAGSFEFNLRFPGQIYFLETGLHYNYYRDYDSTTGRYTQSDPIGLDGGLNTYAYALSNPISNIDPEGLQTPALCANPANAAACAAAGVDTAASRAAARAAVDAARRLFSPERQKGYWTCTARADCNDLQPGNCPDDPMKRFAFGTGVAKNQGEARNAAKSNAVHTLGCQAKHVSCKCTGPTGEKYSGGC